MTERTAEAELRKAFETRGPVLVDVPIDYRDNAKLFESVQTAAVH